MNKFFFYVVFSLTLMSCSKNDNFNSKEKKIQKIWFKSYYENIIEDTAGNFQSSTIDTINKNNIIINFNSDSVVSYSDPMFTKIIQGNYKIIQDPFSFTTTLGVNLSSSTGFSGFQIFPYCEILTLDENEFIFRGVVAHMRYGSNANNWKYYNSYIIYHFISNEQ